MLTRDCHTDGVKYFAALARMVEIDALPSTPELIAERAALDGSWVEERWIERDDVLSEDEAVALEKKTHEAAAARKVERDALKAKLAVWAKNPPPAKDHGIIIATLSQLVHDLLGDN